MTRFRKCYPGLQKKFPGQPACTCVTGRATPQFSLFGDSVQQFTYNESLAYKHKNHVMNNNTSLRVMTVDMTHFAAVCTTRARVTRVQDFVTTC